MSMPGTADSLGISHAPHNHVPGFAIPTVSSGGTNRDMGTLALFLVANWFVNGETVLIDGGVSRFPWCASAGKHTRPKADNSTDIVKAPEFILNMRKERHHFLSSTL
jgi:hypothetical protein